MSAPVDRHPETGRRLTLVITGVPDLTPELANAVYEAAGGDCEVGMSDYLLYVEMAGETAADWQRTPDLLALVRSLVPAAELVRVEAADIVTATERSAAPLQGTTH